MQPGKGRWRPTRTSRGREAAAAGGSGVAADMRPYPAVASTARPPWADALLFRSTIPSSLMRGRGSLDLSLAKRRPETSSLAPDVSSQPRTRWGPTAAARTATVSTAADRTTGSLQVAAARMRCAMAASSGLSATCWKSPGAWSRAWQRAESAASRIFGFSSPRAGTMRRLMPRAPSVLTKSPRTCRWGRRRIGRWCGQRERARDRRASAAFHPKQQPRTPVSRLENGVPDYDLVVAKLDNQAGDDLIDLVLELGANLEEREGKEDVGILDSHLPRWPSKKEGSARFGRTG